MTDSVSIFNSKKIPQWVKIFIILTPFVVAITAFFDLLKPISDLFKSNTPNNPEIHNISSNNQQGGITAETINITTQNISSQNKRHLSEEGKKELSSLLSNYSRDMNIKVASIFGDVESNNFASEVTNYLKVNGWKVDGDTQVAYTQPLFGVVYQIINSTTIQFTVGSNPN